MKKLVMSLLMSAVITMSFFTACKTTTSTSSATSTTESVTTTQIVSTSSTATSTQANWWDKFGTPQYRGTITFATGNLMGVNFDVYNFVGAQLDFWYEALFEPSWTVDRNIWSMTGMFYPDEVQTGNLAESWEINDLTTITVHLRQGVHWQNKAPVNGRELVASDVQAHYDRLLGTGGGYTQKAPAYAGLTATWDSVTATDKYTVVFKFKKGSAQNLQATSDRMANNEIEAPEWVALGGGPSTTTSNNAASPLTDWKTVVGSGPWTLTDLISGSSWKFSKNPDYWGHDPTLSPKPATLCRYPYDGHYP